MKLALILYALVAIYELMVWSKLLWHYRRLSASLGIIMLSLSSGFLIARRPDVWSILITGFSFYRVINLLRLVEGRMKADYLFLMSKKTSFLLIISQLLIFGFWYLSYKLDMAASLWLKLVLVFDLLVSIVLIYALRRHLRTTKPKVRTKFTAEKDLPTLSVLIPARNETIELEECLASLLASDYPKLEILVLDDCSQNKRTPQIIRGFAHDGVEFVEGDLPPEDWLAKNYAYDQLAKKANGEILLFCGVDVRFEKTTIRNIVEEMIERKKTMLSVMPKNNLDRKTSLMIQPSRYAWELALPRRLVNRPPILSTCWVIKSEALRKFGNFNAVKRDVAVEAFFAKKSTTHDEFSFIRSDASVGLSSLKPFDEQKDTAIRTRYPQTHRRPEIVAWLSVIELSVFISPIVFAILAMTYKRPLVFIFALCVCALLEYFYLLVIQTTYQKLTFKAIYSLPIAAIYDIELLSYSMWQYEFKEVLWKGRNICLPLMYDNNEFIERQS
jgi:glycosyltransferase involved in cell wall biosynthesis